jgi:hypothetical protein
MANSPPAAYEYRRVLQFGWNINEAPDGIAVFVYYTPNGIRTELPFSPDNRLELCRQLFPSDPETRKKLAGELLAGSLTIHGPGDIPRTDNRKGR